MKNASIFEYRTAIQQYCSNCNTRIRPKASFCVHCGLTINHNTDEINLSVQEAQILMIKRKWKRKVQPTLQELRRYLKKHFARKHSTRKQDDIFGYDLITQ